VQDVQRQTRKLRKTFGNITETDFFPAEAQKQTDAALRDFGVGLCVRSFAG